jgi:flagellar basal body-associated protein FliL
MKTEDEKKKPESQRHTIFIIIIIIIIIVIIIIIIIIITWRGEVERKLYCYEVSKAVPARPSGKRLA